MNAEIMSVFVAELRFIDQVQKDFDAVNELLLDITRR